MLNMPRSRLHAILNSSQSVSFGALVLLMQYFPTRLFCFVCETIKWANTIGKAVKIASQHAQS